MSEDGSVRRSPRRELAVWLLVVAGAIVIALAAESAWIRVTALDNATWTRNSGQLLESPAVRAAVASYAVDQLFSSRDVTAQLRGTLPPRFKPLAGPLTGALEQAALRASTEALGRPRVQALWRTVNGRAHKQLVATIENKSDQLKITNGAVVLNLAPIVTNIGNRFGISKSALSKVDAQIKPIVLVRAKQLSAVQKLVRILNSLSVVLVAIGFALWAAAVWLARNRRREAVRGMSIGLVIVAFVLLVERSMGGSYIVDSLVKTDSLRPAAQDVWNIYTAGLRNIAVLMLILGIVGVAWAWVSGGSRYAIAARRWFAPVGRDHPGLVHGTLAIVILLIALWAPFGHNMRFFTFALLVLILFSGLEVLRRQSTRELASGESEAPELPTQAMPSSRARATAPTRDDTPSLR